MTTKTVKFKFEKQTTGAIRFYEVNDKGERLSINDGAAIGTLYMRKTALGDQVPQEATAVITLG